MADSEAAGHVWMALKAYHGIRGNIRDLETRQVRWYNEWAAGFKKWAESKGREVTINDWPYPKELECSQASEPLALFSLASFAQSSSQTSSPLGW